MTAFLVDNKAFKAAFAAITPTQSVSVVNFDVGLHSISNCKKSVKFCSAIKDSLPEQSGLSKSGISVKLIITYPNNSNTLIQKDGDSSYKVDVINNPLTMKIQIDGPFLNEGLKKYNKPVRIKVTTFLPTSNEKFKLISEVLRLPLDNSGVGYTFNDKLELSWPTFFPAGFVNGKMTIKLIECNADDDDVGTSKMILHNKIRCDFALIAENGKSISCHTSFLACHSKVFQRMFETDCKEVQDRTSQMRVTEEAVNAFLKFLYYSNLYDAINSPSISLELLQVAHEYDVVVLEKAVKRIFLGNSNDWYNLEVALLLFLYALKVVGYEDLTEKAVEVIKAKPDELRECNALDDLYKNDPESAKELFLLSLKK